MPTDSPPSTKSLGFGIIPERKMPGRSGSEGDGAAVHQAKILLVDDDAAVRDLLTTRLTRAGYSVDAADCARMALDACVRSRPNLVISDLRMPDMDGLSLLKELKSRWPLLQVIILTGHGTIAEAVDATQHGAFGFLVKPLGKDEFLQQVRRAVDASTFNPNPDAWRENIVSRSQLMIERMELANRAAGTDVPVILSGENGTGKELFARAIHAASARREKPFISLSCGAVAEDLMMAELFGNESGGGVLGRAHEGTLLLSEIGELPVSVQLTLSKFLRKTPHLPGRSAYAVRPDVRLICTTSRDLKALVDSGRFLQDLYSEINILPIEIPELGRRREDIPLLVSHFLEQATEPGGQKKIYSREAIELLATNDWPGNVRQLFDLVKKHVAMAGGKVMTREFVQKSLDADPIHVPTYYEARDRFSRDYLVANLQRTAGNVSQSARLAKRNRTDFYKLLARYRLHPDDFKDADSSGDTAIVPTEDP
jgi:two-component system, NtrC family, response regulator GlrR